MELNTSAFIKSLILEEKVDEPVQTKKKRSTYSKTKIEYEQVIGSGIDFVIRRKTSSTSKLLVILASQEQFYIKDEKNDDIEKLTSDNMRNFMKDLGDTCLKIENVSWITRVPVYLRDCTDFMNFLRNFTTKKELIKLGICTYVPTEEANRSEWQIRSSKNIDKIARELADNEFYTLLVKEVSKEFKKDADDDEFTKNLSESIDAILNQTTSTWYTASNDSIAKMRWLFNARLFLKMIYDKYGLEKLRDFIKEYKEAAEPFLLPVYQTDADSIRDLNCEYESLKKYIIHEGILQGYGKSGIYKEWMDTIDMQRMIYGKVKDKYPEYLSSMHLKLSRLRAINQERYDNALFEKVYEKNLKYEKKFYKYIVRLPKDKKDLGDEAQQQSNCVASYFNRMLEGKCVIVFLRKKDTEDESWVTVEIRNNAVIQARMKYNNGLNEEARRALEEYCELVGLELQA